MEHLTTRRYLWFALSAAFILPGLISLVLFGLRLGIDFTGGTLLELRFDQPVGTEQIKSVLNAEGYTSTVVQTSGDEDDNTILIRMPEVQEGSSAKAALYAAIEAEAGSFTELQTSTIGASVGNEIRNRSILAVLLVSAGILLYLRWAFRNLERPLLYGACAIVSMLHDLLLLLGVFSILGEVANVEVDALFVTALLTVVGFSIHDKIVVFDRIRENQNQNLSKDFEEVVNHSLAQTAVRSINNSLTVIFTLLALFLFGGETIKTFVLALLIGMISGTYSSIFTAAQLLVAWEKGEIHRFFDRIRGGRGEPAVAPSR